MRPIRVVLASLPAMLEEIVEDAIGRHADMLVVGRAASAAAVLAEIGRYEPDAVVLGLAPGETIEMQRELLDSRPRMKVVGVTPDGRAVDLFELRPTVVALGNTSPERVVDAIRSALAR